MKIGGFDPSRCLKCDLPFYVTRKSKGPGIHLNCDAVKEKYASYINSKIDALYNKYANDDPNRCAKCTLPFDPIEYDRNNRNIGIHKINHEKRPVHLDCSKAFHRVIPREELKDANHIKRIEEPLYSYLHEKNNTAIVRREYAKGFDGEKSPEEITDMIKEKLPRFQSKL